MDTENTYTNNASFIYPQEDYFLLGILNSKLGWFLISNSCTEIQNGYQLTYDYFKKQAHKFTNRLRDNLSIDKPSKKLETFYKLTFAEFAKELKKKKITLALKEQDEWEEYFNDYKKELTALQAEIDKTDREIDNMVYALYGLTDEEIAVVEAG